MIGGFDGSASVLRKLYGDEAKTRSYDDTRINTLKDDMGGVLIFICPYSIRIHYGLGHANAWAHRLTEVAEMERF